MKGSLSTFGITIAVNRFIEPGGEYGYPDWRERLHRNLSRPSTGKWEPLTHIVEAELYLTNDNRIICHPDTVTKLKAAIIDTSEWRGMYGSP